mgnify:CR=1 FL=1
MAHFEIISNAKKNIYQLVSYSISPKDEGVVFTVSSTQLKKSYLLMTDMVFRSDEFIVNWLERIMQQISQNNYTLIIDEYFERCYVSIGYTTDSKFEMERFTARLAK